MLDGRQDTRSRWTHNLSRIVCEITPQTLFGRQPITFALFNDTMTVGGSVERIYYYPAPLCTSIAFCVVVIVNPALFPLCVERFFFIQHFVRVGCLPPENPQIAIMTETMQLRGTLKGHSGWVTQIATNPKYPDMILSASRGMYTFCLWVRYRTLYLV